LAEIGGIGGLSSVDLLVEQFIATERGPVDTLESSKKKLSNRLNILKDLKTKLSELRDLSREFNREGSLSNLRSKTAVSGNESVFTVSASSQANIGSHSLFIDRLAQIDTGISNQLTRESDSLAKKSTGLQEFSIAVGDGEVITVSITIDAADTDEEVLIKLRNAINESDAEVNASTVQDTSSTVRLVFRSKNSGEEGNITLNELNGSNILSNLNFISNKGDRNQNNGTAGGFLEQDITQLNAKIVFDGIEIIKSSNEITDILPGVTISLHKAQEAGETGISLNIQADVSKAKSEIEAFIEKYNEVIKYLNAKTAVDTENFVRGEFAGDFVFGNLKFSLRGMLTGPVEGLEDGQPKFISQLGLTVSREGLLSIGDRAKFDTKIEENVDNAVGLFSSENGINAQFEELLNRFVNTGGTVDRSKQGVNRQIKSINTRIKNFESRLNIRRESLRQRFTSLQRTLNLLNSQQSALLAQQQSFSLGRFF